MSKYKMISTAVPNVPWQDKPENHEGAPLWRYTENPVIGRNPVEGDPDKSRKRQHYRNKSFQKAEENLCTGTL